jgi:protein phosphatase
MQRISDGPNGLVHAQVALIADGIGGSVSGELASQMAVDTFVEHFREGINENIHDRLESAIHDTNRAIFTAGLEKPEIKGMGTTIVAAAIVDDYLYIAHAGDSRAYLIRNGQIYLLTLDHSWVQEAIDAGYLTVEKAERHPNRNVIKRFLGPNERVEVDHRIIDVENRTHDVRIPQYRRNAEDDRLQLLPGDTLLLCSDGLNDAIPDLEILHIVQRHRPQQAVKELIRAANAAGGPDNISVLLLQHPDRTARNTAAPALPSTIPASESETVINIPIPPPIESPAPTPVSPTPSATTGDLSDLSGSWQLVPTTDDKNTLTKAVKRPKSSPLMAALVVVVLVLIGAGAAAFGMGLLPFFSPETQVAQSAPTTEVEAGQTLPSEPTPNERNPSASNPALASSSALTSSTTPTATAVITTVPAASEGITATADVTTSVTPTAPVSAAMSESTDAEASVTPAPGEEVGVTETVTTPVAAIPSVTPSPVPITTTKTQGTPIAAGADSTPTPTVTSTFTPPEPGPTSTPANRTSAAPSNSNPQVSTASDVAPSQATVPTNGEIATGSAVDCAVNLEPNSDASEIDYKVNCKSLANARISSGKLQVEFPNQLSFVSGGECPPIPENSHIISRSFESAQLHEGAYPLVTCAMVWDEDIEPASRNLSHALTLIKYAPVVASDALSAPITYTLVAINQGTQTITGTLEITDQLPTGITNTISIPIASSAIISDTEGGIDDGRVRWAIENVTLQSNQIITATYVITANGGAITPLNFGIQVTPDTNPSSDQILITTVDITYQEDD